MVDGSSWVQGREESKGAEGRRSVRVEECEARRRAAAAGGWWYQWQVQTAVNKTTRHDNKQQQKGQGAVRNGPCQEMARVDCGVPAAVMLPFAGTTTSCLGLPVRKSARSGLRHTQQRRPCQHRLTDHQVVPRGSLL